MIETVFTRQPFFSIYELPLRAQLTSMKNIFCISLFISVGATSLAQALSEGVSPAQTSISITLPIGSDLKPNGDVVGTPLFNERWMKAVLTTWSHGDVKQDPDYSYNFNLTNNELYIKNGKGELFKADRKAVKSFTLVDGAKSYHFERPKIVDFPSDVFCQVLYDTDSFYVYKSVKKALKAPKKEDNMFQTQDPRMEYEDQTDYYIKLSNKVLETTHRFTLKMLETALPQAREKMFKDFCSKNKISGKLSDEDVVKSIDFLRGKTTGAAG